MRRSFCANSKCKNCVLKDPLVRNNQHNLIQSMSRKATTHDNIMIEIFFGRMKVEMFYGKGKTFKDLNDLEKAIKDYINWYNSDRVCKKLKGLSPINFRKQALNSVSMT